MKTVQSVLNLLGDRTILSDNSLADLAETRVSPMQQVVLWDDIAFIFFLDWVHVEGLGEGQEMVFFVGGNVLAMLLCGDDLLGIASSELLRVLRDRVKVYWGAC